MLTVADIRAWRKMPPDLRGRSVGVLGFARSGQAVAELLLGVGCRVIASDDADSLDLQRAAERLRNLGADIALGSRSKSLLSCDFIVRSPGVPAEHPILTEAQRCNLAIVSELEVAFWFCAAPLIAITGSNGKTTTTEWCGDALRRAGKTVAVCGNVGIPFSAVAPRLSSDGVAIVEVSSFQLENIVHFSPRAAIITNFSPDHLNRYVSYDAYLRAKCAIFSNLKPDAALIVNRGDAELLRRVQQAPGRRLSFGCDSPSSVGSGVDGGDIVFFDGVSRTRFLAEQQLALPGRHNLENALAMICAVKHISAAATAIAASLCEFSGVPHRLEKVAELDGVLWINDSKATNIASGIVALDSYSRPIILLVGGRDKGSDFASVAATIAAKVKRVILFGEAGELIAKAWSHALSPLRAPTLQAAVPLAGQIAEPGDAVLLSPMCASFDEFRNYEDRGEKFKLWVKSLIYPQ